VWDEDQALYPILLYWPYRVPPGLIPFLHNVSFCSRGKLCTYGPQNTKAAPPQKAGDPTLELEEHRARGHSKLASLSSTRLAMVCLPFGRCGRCADLPNPNQAWQLLCSTGRLLVLCPLAVWCFSDIPGLDLQSPVEAGPRGRSLLVGHRAKLDLTHAPSVFFIQTNMISHSKVEMLADPWSCRIPASQHAAASLLRLSEKRISTELQVEGA
jgi:hypothetical protein